jgi:hypothetical protein
MADAPEVRIAEDPDGRVRVDLSVVLAPDQGPGRGDAAHSGMRPDPGQGRAGEGGSGRVIGPAFTIDCFSVDAAPDCTCRGERRLAGLPRRSARAIL